MAKANSSVSLDALQPHIEELQTTLKDIEDDIKAKNKSMIGRYLKEAEEHLGNAKKVFAKIMG